MALDPKVFKAYDVRGIYPSELDEEGAYAIGRAYAEQFEPRAIVVGHDMRVSSPAMAGAAIRGVADAGVDVHDIGLVGTEMVYFAVGELGVDGGIAVTASHNPKEYTGLKIVRRGALPVGGDSGLLDVRDRALGLSSHGRGQTPDVSEGDGAGEPGTVDSVDVYPAFVDKVLSFVDVDAVRPLRVVIDAANGMAGAMLPPVLERLPIEPIRCFFEPDGTFPNHQPNPLLPENREFIVGKVAAEGADLGIAFDGDADRCFFVDDTGEFVPGDFVTALLAASILEKEPGGTIIYDVRASWAVRDTVERPAGRRSSTASATRSSRSGCARSTPSSPARSPATTTSGTSARPTRASSPRSSCSSSCRSAASPCPRRSARTASATSSPARSTSRWPTSRSRSRS